MTMAGFGSKWASYYGWNVFDKIESGDDGHSRDMHGAIMRGTRPLAKGDGSSSLWTIGHDVRFRHRLYPGPGIWLQGIMWVHCSIPFNPGVLGGAKCTDGCVAIENSRLLGAIYGWILRRLKSDVGFAA
jgi:hypothetical protein